VSLRLTVLCVPPLIPLIHRDLPFDEKGVSLLTGTTPALLAIAAIPGSLLISRLGARRTLIGGLAVVACAAALRGIGPSVAVLLLATLVMAVGIAVIQPALPSVVRDWFPLQVGLATAVYSNGLLMGEIIPAALSTPLASLFRGSWELALAAWSIPVLLTALLVVIAMPHSKPDPGQAPARWWPDWHDPETWYLGLIFGAASAVYWGLNAFIPDYLHATGRPGLVAPALTALNGGQIPASILIGAFAKRVIARRWPFIAIGATTLLCLIGLLAMPGAWVVFWAAVFGFAAAAALVCVLALPPLLVEPGDVHRISAAMFTITYTCSFGIPLIAGAAWDATHLPWVAFTPITLAGVASIVLALLLRLPEQRRSGLRANAASE
jgi:CP family cyanate transporter-like MFS transporter